ncbi:glycerol-3-phosphate dehydrogenase [Cytobacillus eiseniae]|uniref:Glycerol-3-phosphate dehydrogenase n=1 Tax=Cytobacillus eiseniae TaxID=762947 RepID=A0ABS4R9A1_9BACI|nr:glycerol-3-phosphate dehydrogenase/oxidase [Cytobacillus eiseniae]MBP2239467.1 glycerol-3-phosphate dehydrogenase [Cytobacillus eiseniae]
MLFSNQSRNEFVNKLTNEKFDVLIIGGGITGAGIALDATLRGMKVALVEMQDFSSGTSSRSTKLIHGGLRYLKQFELKMVAEVGKEREIVYENGPHVTTPEWMLLPIYEGGTFGKISTSIGLRMYDFLAGVRRAERRTMLTVQEVIDKEPLIKRVGLKGGGYYVEYRTDDARLTIEIMKSAASKGATLLNYTKVENLRYENGKIVGASVSDQLTEERYDIHAEMVINAAGPWVDSIREFDGSKKGKMLQLTKGVHLVFDQSQFPLKQAVYFDTPDSRMVFAIPRDGKTYVGTTDTFYSEDPKSPKMTAEDRAYIIHAIHYMFPEVKITEEDVESSWAGVRPLIWEEGKDPSEISRKDEIWESDSGLITIAGGKLTGYRKMAEMIVDEVIKKFNEGKNQSFEECQTKEWPISGGDVGGSSKFGEFIFRQSEKGMDAGLTKEEAVSLAAMYGSNVPGIYQFVVDNGKKEAEAVGLPVKLWLQLKYALDEEMAATPSDFFIRRTGVLLFDIDTVRKYQLEVIAYMANYFGWNQVQKEKYFQQLQIELKNATIPVEGNHAGK